MSKKASPQISKPKVILAISIVAVFALAIGVAGAFYIQGSWLREPTWKTVAKAEGEANPLETMYFEAKGRRISVTYSLEASRGGVCSLSFVIMDENHTRIIGQLRLADKIVDKGTKFYDAEPGIYHIHVVGENVSKWRIMIQDYQ